MLEDIEQVRLSKYSTTNKAFGAALGDGKLYTWGSNTSGQLGTGDCQDREKPVYLNALKRKKISQFALGQGFVVMLGSDISQAELERKKERRRQRKAQKAKSRAASEHERRSEHQKS